MTPTSKFQPDSLSKPLPKMNDPVPGNKRMSRAELIRVALTYTEGLRIGNFSDATPFAKDAYRVENGVFIAGEGCPRANCAGLYTQRVILHPNVIASVAAVDEEAGIVMLWMNFGYTHSYGPNNALVTFEAFKISGGEIQAVNAFFRIMPLETPRFSGPPHGKSRIPSRESPLPDGLVRVRSLLAPAFAASIASAQANDSGELTPIRIDEPNVADTTDGGAQLSPALSQRRWEQEAEANILERLEAICLLAPAGEADKVLETVLNNLVVTNNVTIQRPLHARILLTSPLESVTVGHTIVLSRGLIYAPPDEASLATMLAHELSHAALGHQLIDTKFSFADWPDGARRRAAGGAAIPPHAQGGGRGR